MRLLINGCDTVYPFGALRRCVLVIRKGDLAALNRNVLKNVSFTLVFAAVKRNWMRFVLARDRREFSQLSQKLNKKVSIWLSSQERERERARRWVYYNNWIKFSSRAAVYLGRRWRLLIGLCVFLFRAISNSWTPPPRPRVSVRDLSLLGNVIYKFDILLFSI